MIDPRQPIFDYLRPHLRDGWHPDLIFGMHRELDALGARRSSPASLGAGASAIAGGAEAASRADGAENGAEGQKKGLIPSPAAFAIIKEFEGYAKALPDGRCQAYPDPASGGDPWTIGFGSTGPDVKPGTIWTREQAEARLKKDVNKFAEGVAIAVSPGPTSQNEFDAMVSLAYNIGSNAFVGSTLLKKHWRGDKAGAAREFARWNKAAGKVMAGLTRRREAEAALYRGQGR